MKEKLRIDKYLWAIRLFKTRTLAAAACDNGKVKHNSVSVKASKTVNVGDEYEVKTEAKKWLIKVNGEWSMVNSRVMVKLPGGSDEIIIVQKSVMNRFI